MISYRDVKKVELDGRTFDSKAESSFYLYLKELEKDGWISNIRHQITVELVPPSKEFRAITYRADFCVYDEKEKADVYSEVKGWETPEWKMKLKLWALFGPAKLKVYKVGWKGIDIQREVTPLFGPISKWLLKNK